ncbi:MAG: translocation/assembly module TamB domain-containing protein, partial [Parabacteroides sp.]|nr:translocation/assembly module TamB domain-containing protein [Parabacteroides sp.]
HGPFTHLNVEGDAYVEEGGLGIDFLNTYYTFSDSVHLSEDAIIANNVTVRDKFGNTSLLNLKVNHENFKEANYDIGIQTNNMLVYDVPQKKNPLIFGTVFGTGSATIRGNEQLINFDINMQSAPKTSIQLDFMNNSTALEYDFITFVDKKKLHEQSLTEPADSLKTLIFTNHEEETAELRMNFLLDITPDAKIELIMDPIAGDKIAGNCSGSLQIQYGTKSDLRMYGNVGIVSGNYNFSLQQLIHKNFKIRDGSMVSFRGDPLEATMNINAIYNVTANIQDLDASFAYESARRNIPVNCVLNLDGVLHNPSISFDLELPGSNEELERQVKSIVNTEDMMTRQIVYLLILNKFYTPEYTNNQYKSNDFSAVASSALSSQISSIMNSFTDKVQLGTNIRTSQDGIRDTEVEMILSSQLLNNRLIFNGNFGYKNNATQKNAFIGEFDLEYLLTPNGEVRLKAYNHANDMYMFLKQALTTQGIGIVLKKDFTHFSEIFRRRKKYNLTETKPSLLDKSLTTPATDKTKVVKPN